MPGRAVRKRPAVAEHRAGAGVRRVSRRVGGRSAFGVRSRATRSLPPVAARDRLRLASVDDADTKPCSPLESADLYRAAAGREAHATRRIRARRHQRPGGTAPRSSRAINRGAEGAEDAAGEKRGARGRPASSSKGGVHFSPPKMGKSHTGATAAGRGPARRRKNVLAEEAYSCEPSPGRPRVVHQATHALGAHASTVVRRTQPAVITDSRPITVLGRRTVAHRAVPAAGR